MQLLVVVRFHVAAGKERFNVRKELRVHSHQIFKMAVLRAIFDHPHFAISFDDLRLDLTDFLINKSRDLAVAADDCFTRFDNTVGAKRIGLTRKAKGRLGLLPRFQDWLISPFRCERRIWLILVIDRIALNAPLAAIRKAFLKMLTGWS